MAHKAELFKIPKAALLFGGVMAPKLLNWSKSYQKIYKTVSVLFQVIYGLCLVLFIVEICRVVGNDTKAAIAPVKCLTFVSVVIAKLILVQSKKMRRLINMVSKEETIINRRHDKVSLKMYSQCVRYSNITSLSIIVSIVTSGTFFIIDGMYENQSYEKQSKNATLLPQAPHPVQLWFPFDKNKYYKLAISYEMYHIVGTVIYCSVTQPLLISVMAFLKAELKLLQHFLRNINHQLKSNRNIKEYLKSAAKKYQDIIRFAEEFNNSIQYIVLLEYGVTSLMLAAILIELIQGIKIQFNAAFFVLGLFQLFSLSWNANEIIIESSVGLAMALHETNWYIMDKESTSIILMMLLRCTKPLSISIFGIGQLTIDAAVSRIKLTYSVFSVLSTS